MDQCSDNAIFVIPFSDVELALMVTGALEFGKGEEEGLLGISFVGLIVGEEVSPCASLGVTVLAKGES